MTEQLNSNNDYSKPERCVFSYKTIYFLSLFIYFWLCYVLITVCGLSLVVELKLQ